jgi:chromosome partitioning protein
MAPLKRIAVANQKGGSGKTSTSVNVGAALAECGCRVLIVDCDAQANATVSLGLDYGELEYSLADVLEGLPPEKACLTCQTCPNLFVLPSHPNDLSATARNLSPERGDQFRLKEALASLTSKYDFIFIDCPPSLSILTISALVAADAVLVPVPTEFLSLEGVAQLLDTVDVIRRRFNETLAVLGLLAVRYETRPRGAQVVLSRLADFGVPVFQAKVRKTVSISDAPGAGLPVTLYDPSSRGAVDYRSVAQEVLARAKA